MPVIIINATQFILQKQTSDNGLTDNVHVAANSVQVTENDKFVQTVFDPNEQPWSVITNLECNANTIRIYCSLVCSIF